MSTVFGDITMTLDGFVAGPDISVDHPLGKNGPKMHAWVYPLASWREAVGLEGGQGGAADDLVREKVARTGATIMGRRMFHAGSGDWGENPYRGPWGENPPFHHQVFVLTSHPREPLVMEGANTFTFVTEGPEHALELARAAAGDKDVIVAGGANAIQQYFAAGLLDEVIVHIAPIFLGGGTGLFDGPGLDTVKIEPVQVVSSPNVTHVRYRVTR
jgi:dihydrofolate reductase